MNQAQKNYLVKRIGEITVQKKKSLPQIGPEPEFKKIPKSDKQLLQILKPKILEEISCSNKLTCSYAGISLSYKDIFVQTEVEKYDKLCEDWNKQNSRLMKEIDTVSTKVNDEIMIGDEAKAMKLLKEFEEREFDV